MMTLFNIWHYLAVLLVGIFIVLGFIVAMKQQKTEMKVPIIILTLIIGVFVLVLSIVVIDKYTKKVKVYKVENKRLLGIEKIIYTGFVKNEGNYEIGEVNFEVKLVNKGHATGNFKSGTFYNPFYNPSSFFEFFIEDSSRSAAYKPQTLTEEFVIATNLKPGETKAFRVYFSYPPYFRSTANYTKVRGH